MAFGTNNEDLSQTLQKKIKNRYTQKGDKNIKTATWDQKFDNEYRIKTTQSIRCLKNS